MLIEAMKPLTVGICAHNEDWNIKNLLENVLYHQGLPGNAEIIVVCSGQTINTRKIISELRKKDRRLRFIEERPRQGKAKAVETILSVARGRNIILMTGDSSPDRGCLGGLIKAMQDGTVGIACGKPIPAKRGRLLMKVIVGTLWDFHNWQLESLNDARLLMHASEVFCIRNGIVKKMPEDIVNDDAYLAIKVRARGYRIEFVPGSTTRISVPQTVADYVLQRRRIVAGHFKVHEATGKFSQYLFYSFITRPRLTMNILVKFLADKKRPFSALVTSVFEVVANLLALTDVARKKSYAVWPMVTSSKTSREL
jgi:cellulose synthase/poly-beta-1,6-N-acetylglucosamine synthase-like glycosyltransferase